MRGYVPPSSLIHRVYPSPLRLDSPCLRLPTSLHMTD